MYDSPSRVHNSSSSLSQQSLPMGAWIAKMPSNVPVVWVGPFCRFKLDRLNASCTREAALALKFLPQHERKITNFGPR